MAELLQGAFGLGVLIALAWLMSENRRAFDWRIVAVGLAMQIALAFLFLKTPATQRVFLALNGVVDALQGATQAGTSFVFGYLGGAATPFDLPHPGAAFILAFQALPLVLVMSALSALLWHWRILPLVVKGFAWLLARSFGVGGGVGLASAANVFVGMVEAPLLIRPIIGQLTRSDLFVVMSCGMATIAGTMMVLYATILSGVMADAVGHILTASVVSVPAAVMLARIMVPETIATGARDSQSQASDSQYAGAMDAITRGTQDGLSLLLNIIALLIVLVALVALANAALGLLPNWDDGPVTLQRLLGLAFAPLMWCLGIPWEEAPTAGALMGSKTILNELIAYLELAALPPEALSPRSRLIMLYALCGFANFGSLGIMIGGLSAMAPERRGEIVELGFRSIASGVLATSMTGAIVGLI